jgi:hypothetical protein
MTSSSEKAQRFGGKFNLRIQSKCAREPTTQLYIYIGADTNK